MTRLNDGHWRIEQVRRIDYEIVNVDDVLDPASDALLAAGRIMGGRRFVVVDEQVYGHHRARLEAYFKHHGINARLLAFPGGEAGKNTERWLEVLRELDRFPIHRRDEPIIAIGGGVLTDVVGYVAASYRRGMPHIKVPTTLMGYVDASVGIKTGINFNGHKNRLGAFEPPRRVLLDRQFLRTLDGRQLRNGIAEIIKLAVIKNRQLFTLLEHSGAASLRGAFQDHSGAVILDTAISDMLEELEPNLYEDELARKVDFGHTFSYGLETKHEDRLLHGEAVLLDILVSCALAFHRGLLAAAAYQRILALMDTLDIEPDLELLDETLMWQSLADRIEHRNGQQRVPLPHAIGECCFVHDISRAELAKAIDALTHPESPHHDRIAQC